MSVRKKLPKLNAGDAVGKWYLLSEATRSSTGLKRWNCICKCGNERVVYDQNLKRIDTAHGSRDCGCTRKSLMNDNKLRLKHGKSYSREYKMWKAASERAKSSGLPFDLDIEDVVIPEVCRC